jgi:hypothetical protein
MKMIFALVLMLFLFLTAVPLLAATSDVTLAWDASVDEAIITNYELGWGTAKGTYTNFVTAGLLHEKTLTLADGTWYIAARAKDARGVVSVWSNEVSIVLRTTLYAPSNLRNTRVIITIPPPVQAVVK